VPSRGKSASYPHRYPLQENIRVLTVCPPPLGASLLLVQYGPYDLCPLALALHGQTDLQESLVLLLARQHLQ